MGHFTKGASQATMPGQIKMTRRRPSGLHTLTPGRCAGDPVLSSGAGPGFPGQRSGHMQQSAFQNGQTAHRQVSLEAVAKPPHLNPLPLKGGEEFKELTVFLCQLAFSPGPNGGFEISSKQMRGSFIGGIRGSNGGIVWPGPGRQGGLTLNPEHPPHPSPLPPQAGGEGVSVALCPPNRWALPTGASC